MFTVITWVMLPPSGASSLQCRHHDKHPFDGGQFNVEFERGIRATFRPKHGTVLGIRSTEVVHNTSPITRSEGWHQLGIALIHKRAVVTGCDNVFAAGQRTQVIAKALSSSVISIASPEVEKASEVMVAVEKALKKGTLLPQTLRRSVKRQLDEVDGTWSGDCVPTETPKQSNTTGLGRKKGRKGS
jgi:hypothetical protein